MSEAEEDAHVIERMGQLLAKIAIIVNGPQPKGTLWSYHDLPEKVAALAQDAARWRFVREQDGTTVHVEEPDDDGDLAFVCGHSPEELDAAIDAELDRKGGEG